MTDTELPTTTPKPSSGPRFQGFREPGASAREPVPLSGAAHRSGPSLAVIGMVLATAAGGALAVTYGPWDAMMSWAWALGPFSGLVGLIGGGTALALTVTALRRARRKAAIGEMAVAAMDGSPAGHLITTRDGRVLQANAAARRLAKAPELARLTALETLWAHDAEAAAVWKRLVQAAAAGRPMAQEYSFATRHGDAASHRQLWKVETIPLAGSAGTIHWRIEDITTRREMETVLRDEQVRLSDFLDQAPTGFYSVDADGRFLFTNATFAGWLGVEPARLTDQAHYLHDFIAKPPSGGPGYVLPGAADPSGAVTCEVIGQDGRRRPVSITQQVVTDVDGGVWTRSVARDLSAERKMRRALKASEARFSRLFRDAPIGVVLADRGLAITEWNPAFSHLLGDPDIDLVGQPVASFVEKSHRATVTDFLTSVLAGQERPMPQEVSLALGGVSLTVALYAKRQDGADGRPEGLILQVIDRTHEKNLETQFAQSQKMQAVGQLAGGVAHDFNNLLTAMLGFCDLLLLRHKPGDPSFGDIMQIKQNANRAANLVRQLLAFSRQQTLQPRVINLTDALAELSNLLRRLIGENIELKLVHGRDLGLIKVDQGQLEQVIINLAVNARDAMPRGGRLTLTTRNLEVVQPIRRGTDMMPPGRYVAIDVADTGTGIPPDIIDRVFDPFFSTKEVGHGTGLGLSTVYGIVRQTGGYIAIDSEVGRGTVFQVALPRFAEEGALEPAGSVEDIPLRDLTGAGRILLVEDEDPVRLFGARALRNKGYDVLEASSGEEALEIIAREQGRLDLLITDVVMPRMDGPALIRAVRQDHPDLRVICISGYAEDRLRQNMAETDSSIGFLPKPFTLKQLASAVKDAFAA